MRIACPLRGAHRSLSPPPRPVEHLLRDGAPAASRGPPPVARGAARTARTSRRDAATGLPAAGASPERDPAGDAPAAGEFRVITRVGGASRRLAGQSRLAWHG